MRLLVEACNTFEDMRGIDIIDQQQPVYVTCKGDLAYERIFDSLQIPTYSPETRVMLKEIMIEDVLESPSAEVQKHMKVVAGPSYRQVSSEGPTRGMMTVNLDDDGEGEIVWENVEDEVTVDGPQAEQGDSAREVTDIEDTANGLQISRLCDETETISLENVSEVASASPGVARGTKRARASKPPRERKKKKQIGGTRT
ncbi:hypothetical protein G6F46_006507 [Rhizopus delemar]|uniref:Uncharacterized protein n=2 Tax=Rhizopus TaxID=4842 RepID=A0A9P7CNM5_9FUNG|nr:hypothetical protein G6F55_005026 [Rhizopus delemar]KAG1545313.1 hypothetical protein G6F51_005540 [Rhizopus arrhizus]KAG1497385.1 hypothetical protein G6F54_005797 [Rhizopus delemar]KAG1514685.1 hypothetical protein G6F53_003493 [Rhizopus delemar]KAG1526483.1 hypothetical protein G6F52_002391 [Rhizopus delemar]